MMSVRTRSALFLAALAMAALPDLAQAQISGANEMIGNVGEEIDPIPRLLALISYICGAWFAATGLVKLKDWINEGDKAGLSPALFRLALAPILILLPFAIKISTSTFLARGSGENMRMDAPQGMVKGVNMNAFQRRE